MLVALLNYLFLAVLAEEPNKADLLRDDFLMSQLHENMRELKNAIDAFTTKDSKEAKLQIHGFMTSLHDMIEYETRTRYNK
jgi:ribosomal protein S17E